MIVDATPQAGGAVVPLTVTLPVELSDADRARVDQALFDSRAPSTRTQYRSAWKGWTECSASNGHATLPADHPAAVAVYLAERTTRPGCSGLHGPRDPGVHRGSAP